MRGALQAVHENISLFRHSSLACSCSNGVSIFVCATFVLLFVAHSSLATHNMQV